MNEIAYVYVQVAVWLIIIMGLIYLLGLEVQPLNDIIQPSSYLANMLLIIMVGIVWPYAVCLLIFAILFRRDW